MTGAWMGVSGWVIRPTSAYAGGNTNYKVAEHENWVSHRRVDENWIIMAYDAISIDTFTDVSDDPDASILRLWWALEDTLLGLLNPWSRYHCLHKLLPERIPSPHQKNTKNTTFRKKLLPSSGPTVKNPDTHMLALIHLPHQTKVCPFQTSGVNNPDIRHNNGEYDKCYEVLLWSLRSRFMGQRENRANSWAINPSYEINVEKLRSESYEASCVIKTFPTILY
jgi:hypothetical protein